MGRQVGGQQRQSVTCHDGHHAVRRGEEYPDQVRRLAIGRRVHQDDQQHADAEIDRAQCDNPRTFAFFHPGQEQQRHQRKEHHHPIEFSGPVQYTGDVPVARVRTMDEVLARTTTRAQFNTSLLLVFAIAAVLLASIGVYSLIAYTVVQSRPEIAIRMALGAEPRVVRNMFVRKGAVLIGIGITSGVFMAWAGARLLTAFLFGVSPRDPLTFIAVPVALALVALLATWRPASGASKVSPIELLRT